MKQAGFSKPSELIVELTEVFQFGELYEKEEPVYSCPDLPDVVECFAPCNTTTKSNCTNNPFIDFEEDVLNSLDIQPARLVYKNKNNNESFTRNFILSTKTEIRLGSIIKKYFQKFEDKETLCRSLEEYYLRFY
jgi:hypothetical protein